MPPIIQSQLPQAAAVYFYSGVPCYPGWTFHTKSHTLGKKQKSFPCKGRFCYLQSEKKLQNTRQCFHIKVRLEKFSLTHTPSSSSIISFPIEARVVHLQLLVARTAQRLWALNLHTREEEMNVINPASGGLTWQCVFGSRRKHGHTLSSWAPPKWSAVSVWI